MDACKVRSKKVVNIPYEQSFALHGKREKKEEKEINNSHNKQLNFSLQSFVVLNTENEPTIVKRVPKQDIFFTSNKQRKKIPINCVAL